MPLKVTLDELYSGCTKRRAVTRKQPAPGGGVTEVKVRCAVSTAGCPAWIATAGTLFRQALHAGGAGDQY